MGITYRCHHIRSCFASLLLKAAEALRHRPTRPAVFLHHSHTAGARVCVSGVALEYHGSKLQGAGVASAESDADNLRRRRLPSKRSWPAWTRWSHGALSQSGLVWESITKLQHLPTNNCVRLLWVPGHSNTAGNETADKLAKQSASLEFIGAEPAPGLSMMSTKCIIGILRTE